MGNIDSFFGISSMGNNFGKRDCIIINAAKCPMIPIYNEEWRGHEYRGLTLTHYTNEHNLYRILSEKVFVAKALSAYKSQREFIDNEFVQNTSFKVSFTKDPNVNDKMWKVKRDANVKIDFYFTNNVKSLIDTERPLSVSNSLDDLLQSPAKFYMLNSNSDEAKYGKVFVAQRLNESEYCVDSTSLEIQLYEAMTVDGISHPVLGETSVHELQEWENQCEIELVLTLMTASTENIEIPKCRFMSVPITYDGMDNIVITMLSSCVNETYEKLSKLLDIEHIKYKIVRV